MTITKTGLTYTATSLEDIAAEFERLAGESDTYPDESHDYCAGLANAFEKAAAILRATKLEPPSDNVGKSEREIDEFVAAFNRRPDNAGITKVTTQNTEECNHQWVTTLDGTADCPKCGKPCPD